MQLGVGTAGTAQNSNVRAGQGPRLQGISCTGTEATWEQCTGATWSNATCDAAGNVIVACTGLQSEAGSTRYHPSFWVLAVLVEPAEASSLHV